MKRHYLIVIAACSMTLSGCIVHDHHRHRVPAAKIVVPVPVVVERAAPQGCPPGQAKKGNCR